MDCYANIPPELKQRAQWVVWGIPDRPLKAPYDPGSLLCGRPQAAKAGVRETWGGYESALQCVSRGLAKGLGYELDGGALFGVDLDGVLDATGALTPEARKIVELLCSYTEISPSGKGLHIFVNSDDVSIIRHRRKGGFLEIYNDRRYFTVTGRVYGGLKPIEARSGALRRIHDQWLLPAPDPALAASARQPDTIAGGETDRLKTGLAKDPVMRSFWLGEHRHGDESASDQAFMNKLAYWCGANPPAMLRAFFASPYFAQKDEAHKRKCRRADYLPQTAKRACATLRSTAWEDHLRWRQSKPGRGKGSER